MDRAELSAAIIDELARLFVNTLKENAAELLQGDLDAIEQRVQIMIRGVLGRVVEEAVIASARAHPIEWPNCSRCSRRMRLVDLKRPRELQGLVGDYYISRQYFVCDKCHEGCAPLDERLGIGAGALSPGLERVVCRLGLDASFCDAVDAVDETLRIKLKGEIVRRATEGIGQVAELEAQAAISLAQAGKDPWVAEEIDATSAVLLVETDGVMVHEVDGGWHEVKTGLVAPLGPKEAEDKKTGRSTLAMGKASYCAGFETAETFWFRLYAEACRRGLGTPMITLIVVLGDGADWIWRYAASFLAVEGVKLVQIVDIYHAFEHLAVVCNAVFGQGSTAAKEYLDTLKKRLEVEGVAPILEALGELQPQSTDASEEVRKAINYFYTHAAYMDYPSFRAQKLPIGSGAIESTCKTLIQKREKGAGMRWTETGAQAVATLRALYKSGRWDKFWQTHPQRRRQPVLSIVKRAARPSAEPAEQAA